ncbi:ABC-type sugar (aldose) transport system, ATPase component [Lentisphaera araneosa HTCC2155]|jgi:ribose transport system ATP-binding protein|uniref:ABC-type sugar (Aldose) transport system, ATPase component n=1 Tax=Lentisphaera araneosa HTCC2155 TaxID=313628 RepID=A6DJS0_9BACT|nr:sugar ABC transporter ATP-binding protein [Lentisphaera araneosa]EDM28144.1 ABC-type sugar (aldose) transport system, ATPase component [Lentisphaera araneosa HTCC2155]
MSDKQELLLQMRGIHKRFPGVHAIKGIDMALYKGEVLALMGENGAGKSTLIKMLGGAHQPTEGIIELKGEKIEIENPQVSQDLGIGIIYQEFNLIPHLTVRENIFLGKPKSKKGVISKKEEHQHALELFQKIGIDIDPETLCCKLSTAEQQIVEIVKALSSELSLLVMDEPSATLTPQEVEGLFKIIRDLQKQGIGIIYISHRLDEIFDIANRVTVMRDGEYIGTKEIEEITRQEMIEMMVGRKVENEFPKHYHKIGAPVLEVSEMNSADVKNASFTVHAGEVLGFTGLVGAGRTELMRLIFGADKKRSGTVKLHGKELDIKSPGDAIAKGIGLLTEDRKGQGLVLMHSVRENFGLPNLGLFSKKGVINAFEEKKRFAKHIESMKIKIPHQEQLAKNLSGGNQQKVVLAKWLEQDCEVIIIDEPTRGIDVGAKYEIYMLINQLAEQGKAIIMISSELPEVIGMSDRIVVMRSGHISAVVEDVQNTTQEILLDHAIH